MGYRHNESSHYRRRARWAALRACLAAPTRFAAMVVCSAVLSVVMQEAMPSMKHHTLSMARSAKRLALNAWHYAPSMNFASLPYPAGTAPREAAFVPTRIMPGMEQYERYYSEAMPMLRADASVTLLSVEVPAAALQYQNNGRTKTRTASYALRARSRSFPAIAVSRNARAFLESMRLTFVDPKRLPSSLIENIGTPVDRDRFVENFLLVPDVTGERAGLFSFQPATR